MVEENDTFHPFLLLPQSFQYLLLEYSASFRIFEYYVPSLFNTSFSELFFFSGLSGKRIRSNRLPDAKILALAKSKTFADDKLKTFPDDKLNVTQKHFSSLSSGRKQWEKKKVLATSIFSFSNSVFKRFPTGSFKAMCVIKG